MGDVIDDERLCAGIRVMCVAELLWRFWVSLRLWPLRFTFWGTVVDMGGPAHRVVTVLLGIEGQKSRTGSLNPSGSPSIEADRAEWNSGRCENSSMWNFHEAEPYLQSTRFTSCFTILALNTAFCWYLRQFWFFLHEKHLFCWKFLHFSIFYIAASFTPLSVPQPRLGLRTATVESSNGRIDAGLLNIDRFCWSHNIEL